MNGDVILANGCNLNKQKEMNIKGNTVYVKKSQENLYNHLLKLENFKDLMPNNIEKFVVEGESFLFGLKGMPEIRLIIKEKTPHSQIVLGSASSKLSFNLFVDIKKDSEKTSNVQLSFEGKFNMMMAMMVKKPLTKFIDVLSDSLENL